MPVSASKAQDAIRLERLWDALNSNLSKDIVTNFLSGAGIVENLISGGYGVKLLHFLQKEFSSSQITKILTSNNAALAFAVENLSKNFTDLVQTLDILDKGKVLTMPGLALALKNQGAAIPDVTVDVATSWAEFTKIESKDRKMAFLSNFDFVKKMVFAGKGKDVLDFMVDEFPSPKVAAMLSNSKVALVFAGTGLGRELVECIDMLKKEDKERVLAVPGLVDALKTYGSAQQASPKGPAIGPK